MLAGSQTSRETIIKIELNKQVKNIIERIF